MTVFCARGSFRLFFREGAAAASASVAGLTSYEMTGEVRPAGTVTGLGRELRQAVPLPLPRLDTGKADLATGAGGGGVGDAADGLFTPIRPLPDLVTCG